MSKKKTKSINVSQLSFVESDDFFSEVYLATNFLENFDIAKKRKCTNEVLEISKKKGNKKGSIFYLAHSYPTKVPVENIINYIISNTNEGDTVLDPFCGSGMTALACRLTGRNSFVSDIGSLALHLTTNHVRTCNPVLLKSKAEEIIKKLILKNNEYEVDINGKTCTVNYIVISDILICKKCEKKHTAWEFIVGEDLHTKSKASCPHCGSVAKASSLDRDGQRPAFVSYWIKGEKKLKSISLTEKQAAKICYNKKRVQSPIDDILINKNREMYIRSALQLHNINSISDFYTDRNISAISRLYKEIQSVEDQRLKAALMFAFTNSAWHGSKLRRYNSKGGHRPLTGTLYIPQLISEGNVFQIFLNKIDTLCEYYKVLENLTTSSDCTISLSSATKLQHVKSNSVDYIFTDPPFGSNIFYADCNIIAEAWLGKLTDMNSEAVVNKSLKESIGGKSLRTYENLMTESFREMARVLKKDGKAHIVFNSTEGKVWASLVSAIANSGLRIVKTLSLDKFQKSFKGNKSALGLENVSTTDVVFEVVIDQFSRVNTKSQRVMDNSKVLNQAWSAFSKTNKNNDDKFIVADFYNYLVRRCAINSNVDPSVLDYETVKSFVEAA